METDELLVVMDGSVSATILPRGKKSRLLYDTRQALTPVSLSMPISGKRFRSDVLTPWTRGLLPDREEVLKRWRRHFGVRTLDPIDLLVHVGEDVAGGAMFVRPDRLTAAMTWEPAKPLAEREIGDMLRRAISDAPDPIAGIEAGKFSLAGMQPKIALQQSDDGGWSLPSGINPTTHLIKPAVSNYQDQHLVEHMTMFCAADVGLSTAKTRPAVIDGIPVVVVTRFDRLLHQGRWIRIHQEDLLQAMSRNPWEKYESEGGPGVREVAAFLRRHELPEESLHRFAQSVIFHWLTASTDAHAKNYSVLLNGTSATLAPLYDLNSYLAYGTPSSLSMSMKVGSEYGVTKVSRSDWAYFAKDCGVTDDWVMSEIDRQSKLIPVGFKKASEQLVAQDGFDTVIPDRMVEASTEWVDTVRRSLGLVARAAAPAPARLSRGKTTRASNRGSFKTVTHQESDVTLDPH